MSYKISQKAQDDIINIYLEGFEILGNSPKISRLRYEFDPPVRIHPYQSHVIIYVIDDENDVFIVRVRGSVEDWISNPVG